jgi:hypothetical protein
MLTQGEKLTVQEIDPVDSLYLYSKEEEKVLVDQEPWATKYAPSPTMPQFKLMKQSNILPHRQDFSCGSGQNGELCQQDDADDR